jgi:hypothetical protein
MNIYQYIAQNSPNECYEICKQYGIYNVADIDELSIAIAQLVATEGEKAFKQVLELHPDKDVIIETYQVQIPRPLQFNGSTSTNYTNPDISGVPTKVFFDNNPLKSKYYNADGNSGENKLVNQTNLFILVGAMIVSLAIISIKK